MAQPFKRIAQFFKRNAPLILTVAGQPELGAVVAAVEAKADAKATEVPAAAPDAAPAAPQALPQVFQGGLTLTSLAVAAVAYELQRYGLVPAGYDAATAAGVLVALGVAAYGRIRREWRP
jgi:hypothetical protein